MENTLPNLPKNIICFSHLRWDFVFQRPQQLLTRFAKTSRVFYIEEPVFDADQDHYEQMERGENLIIVVPHMRSGLLGADSLLVQKDLLDKFMTGRDIQDHIFWYYTPMALEFSQQHRPELTVFDCMDELSAFRFAPEALKANETKLFQLADIVFTGGYSLYEAKKNRHPNIHSFPSSIDTCHFGKARVKKELHQKAENVKLGFFGVIDERFDIELIREIAKARPAWTVELIGPVAKIDPATLPDRANIHYAGAKSYQELPDLIADWDIALIPFLMNESTRFISPTKTPEYLAAGLPVVSTPIPDVINPYAKLKLVQIGTVAADFVAACEWTLSDQHKNDWLARVDDFLAKNSWDLTCGRMLQMLEETADHVRSPSISR